MKKGEKLYYLIKKEYPFISMSEFGRRVGVKKTTLHDILNKDSLDKVTIENIRLISRALNMTIDELLETLDS